MSENQPVSREHGLDNLRVFVIILVVVLHASLSYMAFAPQWWYVLDPKRSLFFTGLVLLIDVPIMLIMFFLPAISPILPSPGAARPPSSRTRPSGSASPGCSAPWCWRRPPPI